MSNLVMWNLIVGFLLPLVVAVIQQPKFNERTRSLVTALAAIVFGGGTAFFTGDFNGKDIVTSILITGVSAISFYKGFWKPTSVAPVIESRTSGAPPRSGRDENGYTDLAYVLVVALLAALLVYVIFRLF